MIITAYDIVSAIDQLPKDRFYHYINPQTAGQIKIARVQLPGGPITIKRFNPVLGGTLGKAREESISTQMIWRLANAFREGQPINVDRVFGGSYNTRSVLESLLAHTPQFFYCYPGRIESIASSVKIKEGHKHLIWLPNSPHALGVVQKHDTKIIISEVPNLDVFYDSLTLPTAEGVPGAIDIEIQRRHAQIQVALIMIGMQLGYRTWVAQNDKGIIYRGRRIGEIEGVVVSLDSVQLMQSFPKAVRAALLIDCVWFKNHKLMPAVIEIEHTTGVTTGLTRMKNLQDSMPPYPTRYVIAAPDEDRNKVAEKASQEQFASLNVRYFPFSAVEELYGLCQRRKLRGVTEEFLDCFMEPVLPRPGALSTPQ